MRLLEAPLAHAHRARERAAHVAEHLRLEQRLGNGADVERDEAVRPPRAVVMNRAGDDFLAGPGLAGDQDRAVRAGHRLEHVKERLHRPALSEDAAESIALLELRAQVRVLRLQPPLLERLVKHVHQLVELKWLRNEVRRAPLDRIHGVFHGAIAGDDDADDAGIAFDRGLDHVRAVDAGHPEVGDDDVEGELFEELEGALAAFGLRHLEAALAEPFRHERPQRRLVVYEEEVRVRCRRHLWVLPETRSPQPPIAGVAGRQHFDDPFERSQSICPKAQPSCCR